MRNKRILEFLLFYILIIIQTNADTHHYRVIRKICPIGSYHDPMRDKCRKVPGGGEMIKINVNARCGGGFVGLLAHSRKSRYYYVCKNDAVLTCMCKSHELFNKIRLKCEGAAVTRKHHRESLTESVVDGIMRKYKCVVMDGVYENGRCWMSKEEGAVTCSPVSFDSENNEKIKSMMKQFLVDISQYFIASEREKVFDSTTEYVDYTTTSTTVTTERNIPSLERNLNNNSILIKNVINKWLHDWKGDPFRKMEVTTQLFDVLRTTTEPIVTTNHPGETTVQPRSLNDDKFESTTFKSIFLESTQSPLTEQSTSEIIQATESTTTESQNDESTTILSSINSSTSSVNQRNLDDTFMSGEIAARNFDDDEDAKPRTGAKKRTNHVHKDDESLEIYEYFYDDEPDRILWTRKMEENDEKHEHTTRTVIFKSVDVTEKGTTESSTVDILDSTVSPAESKTTIGGSTTLTSFAESTNLSRGRIESTTEVVTSTTDEIMYRSMSDFSSETTSSQVSTTEIETSSMLSESTTEDYPYSSGNYFSTTEIDQRSFMEANETTTLSEMSTSTLENIESTTMNLITTTDSRKIRDVNAKMNLDSTTPFDISTTSESFSTTTESFPILGNYPTDINIFDYSTVAESTTLPNEISTESLFENTTVVEDFDYSTSTESSKLSTNYENLQSTSAYISARNDDESSSTTLSTFSETSTIEATFTTEAEYTTESTTLETSTFMESTTEFYNIESRFLDENNSSENNRDDSTTPASTTTDSATDFSTTSDSIVASTTIFSATTDFEAVHSKSMKSEIDSTTIDSATLDNFNLSEITSESSSNISYLSLDYSETQQNQESTTTDTVPISTSFNSFTTTESQAEASNSTTNEFFESTTTENSEFLQTLSTHESREIILERFLINDTGSEEEATTLHSARFLEDLPEVSNVTSEKPQNPLYWRDPSKKDDIEYYYEYEEYEDYEHNSRERPKRRDNSFEYYVESISASREHRMKKLEYDNDYP